MDFASIKITYEDSINFYSKFLQENFTSEDQTQEYQALISFLHRKLGFAKLCEILPIIKKTNLKNESASLLQKLIDHLLENNLITKEEILDFIQEKPHNSTFVATVSSFFKESYLNNVVLNGNEDFNSKLSNQRSNKKTPCKKYRKQRKSTYEGGYYSSYSNYSGVLFDEASSMGFGLLMQASVIEGLKKIEEDPIYNNSSSLQDINMERPFRENFHETYG